MRSSNRTEVARVVAGLVVCAAGVVRLLFRGPEPIGTILLVGGGGFAASLLASTWVHRSQG